MKYLAINTAVKTEILLSLGLDSANGLNLSTDKFCTTSFNFCADNNCNIPQKETDIQNINGDFYFSSAEKSATGTLLLHKIDQMLDMAQVTLTDLDFLACVVGPGSFTGIRVGVSAVRALAYALNKPIIPITYFDVCAYNGNAPFTVAIDGGCGVCYVKNFNSYNQINAKGKNTSQILDISNISNQKEHCDSVCTKNEELRLFAHKEVVADSNFNEAVTRTLPEGHHPLKWAVEKAANENSFVNYDNLRPLYLRRSQPEREQGEL